MFTDSTGITVSNISSTNTSVTANISISNDVGLGDRLVKVITPGGESNQLTFTITENFFCFGTYDLPPVLAGDMNYNLGTDGEIVSVGAFSDGNTVTKSGSAEFDIDLTFPNLSEMTTVFANWFLQLRVPNGTNGQVSLKFYIAGQLVGARTLTASTDGNGNTTTNGVIAFPGTVILNPTVESDIKKALSGFIGSHVTARVEVIAQATGTATELAFAEGGLGGFAMMFRCDGSSPRYNPSKQLNRFIKKYSVLKSSKEGKEENTSTLVEPEPLVDSVSWDQSYSYDRFGNRLSVTGTNAQTLNISSTKNRITDPGYEYDLAGNLIADPSGKQFEYDAENRLIKVLSGTTVIAEYFYDANGWRIKKVTQSGTTRFVYDQGGRLLSEYDGEPVASPTREHIYGASGMLATVEADKISYHTPDHLGSPRVLTDGSGTIISRRDFFPFGEQISGLSNDGRNNIFGYSITDSIRQKFTSYFRDDETGLDFAQARYYANVNGRFTSVDPISVNKESLVNPQRWNLYNYALNNPINSIDINGGQSKGKGGDKTISLFLVFPESQRNQTQDGVPIPGPDYIDTNKKLSSKGYNLKIYGLRDPNAKLPRIADSDSFERELNSSEVVSVVGHGADDAATEEFDQAGLVIGSSTYTTTGQYNGSTNQTIDGRVSTSAKVICSFSCDSNTITAKYFKFTGNEQYVVSVNGGENRKSAIGTLEQVSNAFIKAYAATKGSTEQKVKAGVAAGNAIFRKSTVDKDQGDFLVLTPIRKR